MEAQYVCPGIIYSNETQKPLARATVFLENLSDGKKDSVITDATGHYDFLVKPNKQYHIRAIREGFPGQMIKMNTHGLFQGNLLNDFVLEEEFIDKVVIQFDYDQYAIRPDELPELDEVLKVLKRRPNSRIHIGAYADSKGTTEYNQRLSDNRGPYGAALAGGQGNSGIPDSNYRLWGNPPREPMQ